mgnify:CR=1 FL=1
MTATTSTTYLWTPPPVQSLPVRGSAQRLPIHRLFFVGRNYHAHAVEMGRPVDKAVEVPFYFTKAPSTLVESGATVAYPPGTQNYHHEMELVLAIGAPGFRVSEADAPRLVYGYACGLDMTRRDLQNELRQQGRPWCIAKGFESSAPIGAIVPAEQAGDMAQASIRLLVNGQVHQQSNTAQMIWNVAEIIATLSQAWTLQPGDLIYTGTPEGVGPVVRGDVLCAEAQGLPPLQVRVA